MKKTVLINSNLFKKMTEINDEFYEFELHHKTVKLDTPCHVGYFILQIAKLRMLEFYYDCLLKYVPRNNFALTEIDTDSMYFGLSKSSKIDCVKPELKQEFLKYKIRIMLIFAIMQIFVRHQSHMICTTTSDKR